jgi:hypothetical protein
LEYEKRVDCLAVQQVFKQFTISGITVARLANGKIAEAFLNWDALGLMQQFGVVPELAKAKAAAAKP